MLVDTHAHIHFDDYRPELDDVLTRAADASVETPAIRPSTATNSTTARLRTVIMFSFTFPARPGGQARLHRAIHLEQRVEAPTRSTPLSRRARQRALAAAIWLLLLFKCEVLV